MTQSTGGFLMGTLDERSQDPVVAVNTVHPFPSEIRRTSTLSVRDWRYLNEEVRRLSGSGVIGIYRLTTAADDLAESETDRKILEKYAPMGVKLSVVIESDDCVIAAPAPQDAGDLDSEPAGPPAPTVTPGLSALARGVKAPPAPAPSEKPASGPNVVVWIGAAVGLLAAAGILYKVTSGGSPAPTPGATVQSPPVITEPVISNPTAAPAAPPRQTAAPAPATARTAPPKPRTPAPAPIPEPKQQAAQPVVAAPPQLQSAPAPAPAIPQAAAQAPAAAPPQPDRRGEALKALERDARRQEALKALEAGAAEKAKRDAALRALGQK